MYLYNIGQHPLILSGADSVGYGGSTVNYGAKRLLFSTGMCLSIYTFRGQKPLLASMKEKVYSANRICGVAILCFWNYNLLWWEWFRPHTCICTAHFLQKNRTRSAGSAGHRCGISERSYNRCL